MIIQANTVLTGDGSSVIRNGSVRIDDTSGLITAVGPAADIVPTPDETVVNYHDATILPGLIDMHVHLGYWWGKPDLENYDDFMIAYMSLDRLQQAHASGVTTLRDLASPDHLCEKMRMAEKRGYISIPRIFHCNRAICASGGHGWDLTGGTVECDSPEEIRKAVRIQLREGADWIKVMDSHRTELSEFTQEELHAAVSESHRHGVKISVHAGPEIAVEMALRAGFDTIEHGTFMTLAQGEYMAQHGIAWVPTIVAYASIYETALEMQRNNTPEEIMAQAGLTGAGFTYFQNAAEAYRKNFKALYDTGVTVCAGTDMVMDGAPASPVWKELWYMTQYGLTPVEAVRTATVNSARVLGMAGILGELSKNAVADICVAAGDITTDITRLKDVIAVYQSGRLVFTK